MAESRSLIYLMNKNILASLLEVARLLNNNNIKWMLVGSSNLALQGMNFEPNDIDIVIPIEKEKEVLNFMSGYSLLKTENLIRKDGEEKMFLVGEKVVELSFENENGFYLKFVLEDNLEEKEIEGVRLPCMRLENEALAYENLDRIEKARMIRDFLKNKGKERLV